MSDRLAPTEDNSIVAFDIVEGQLVFKRYDGSTFTYGEVVEPPVITDISPSPLVLQTWVTVTVTGTDFDESSVVRAEVGVQATEQVSDTTLTFEWPVWPSFPPPGPEMTFEVVNVRSNSVSNTVTVPIVENPDKPTISSFNPPRGVIGVPLTLSIIGTKFVPSVGGESEGWVTVDGMQTGTTFVSDTNVTINLTPNGGNNIMVYGEGGVGSDNHIYPADPAKR